MFQMFPSSDTPERNYLLVNRLQQSARMEVSRRKVLQKHLQPARPLRRCSHVDAELQMNAATCAEAFMVEEIIYGLKQAYKIVNFQEKAKDKISYTREFLIGLASCPEAKKKPESLPDHPIVLSEVRDPSCLNLSEAWIREGHDERKSYSL